MKHAFGLILALLFMLSTACWDKETSGARPPVNTDPVLEERIAKDRAFKNESTSPLPASLRATFKGLAYYPIDPNMRFTVRLERYLSPKQVRLATNTGEIRTALRYGYFEFRIADQVCRLQAYRLDDAPGSTPYLFIPFRDATSGRETYGAGRYLDLKENTTGIYELDFNRAYNPFCAYNEEFSCPLAPEENTLKVAIRAGEKNYVPARSH